MTLMNARIWTEYLVCMAGSFTGFWFGSESSPDSLCHPPGPHYYKAVVFTVCWYICLIYEYGGSNLRTYTCPANARPLCFISRPYSVSLYCFLVPELTYGSV